MGYRVCQNAAVGRGHPRSLAGRRRGLLRAAITHTGDPHDAAERGCQGLVPGAWPGRHGGLSNLGLYVVVYGTGVVLGPGEDAVAPSLALIKKYRYTDEASWQHWREINEDCQRVVIVMTPEQWVWRDV